MLLRRFFAISFKELNKGSSPGRICLNSKPLVVVGNILNKLLLKIADNAEGYRVNHRLLTKRVYGKKLKYQHTEVLLEVWMANISL